MDIKFEIKMINIYSYIGLLKKHSKGIIIFILMINIMAILSFGTVFNSHINYVNTQINNNISEYGEIDREQLCNIAECTGVIDLNSNKYFEPNQKGHLKKISLNNSISFTKIYNNLFINNRMDLSIYNKEANTYFIINKNLIINEYLLLLSFFMPFAILFYILPLINSIKKEQEEAILITAGSEALLTNKSMINITENIHHELNTPLEVIDNKIEKINRIVSNFLIDEYERTKGIDSLPEDRVKRNRKLALLQEDFGFIQQMSEIIQDSGEVTFHGEIGNLIIDIIQMNTYEKELIICE